MVIMIGLLIFSSQCTHPSLGLLNLIDDCERFVLGFFDVIEESAVHIYHSALLWSPTSSLTRQLYSGQMTTEVKLVNAVDAQWNVCIRTISIPNYSLAVTFSHSGSALAVISAEEELKIFETVTGVTISEIDNDHAFGVRSFTFSPDECMLVCGFEDGAVMV
jgi:WD40 repeat protein